MNNNSYNKELFQSAFSDASFLMPKWLKPSAWHQHAPFAFFLTEAIKPKIIVELGTHHGFSFFCFCQAVSHYMLDTKCYAVDTWLGDEHSGFYNNKIFEEVEEYCDTHYSKFAYLKRMTFNEAVSDFEDKSIDILHIDGRHHYDDVKQNFLDWFPKLSDCSIVLFHDTQVRNNNFGVYRFWEQLMSFGPSFEFYHHCGLGVLSSGSVIHENIQNLFLAQKNSSLANDIRVGYERLGLSIVLINKL
jgi:hypothetical protein